MSDIERSIQAYFDGINEERFDDVGALFGDDGELIAPGSGVRRGRKEIAAYFAAALKPYPKHFDDPTRVIIAGNTVTVEIHYTGALEDGTPMEFDAVDVFDFGDDGKITRMTSWYDSHAVREQLRAARRQAV